KVLISASDDGTVKMWDIESGRQFRTIKSHKGPVRGIALSADGKYLATAGNDRVLTLWEGGE
ncbi:MAG: WD40 repeat domain-containing protein, partial [Nitrospirota bacterium]|nr:WD40 repeat domain-containing protein [Nitrospirota bacterium]